MKKQSAMILKNDVEILWNDIKENHLFKDIDFSCELNVLSNENYKVSVRASQGLAIGLESLSEDILQTPSSIYKIVLQDKIEKLCYEVIRICKDELSRRCYN